MMNRRSFLQSILLTATAPAIVRADSLMRIVPRDTTILTEQAIEEAMIEILRMTDSRGKRLGYSPKAIYVLPKFYDAAVKLLSPTGMPVMSSPELELVGLRTDGKPPFAFLV